MTTWKSHWSKTWVKCIMCGYIGPDDGSPLNYSQRLATAQRQQCPQCHKQDYNLFKSVGIPHGYLLVDEGTL